MNKAAINNKGLTLIEVIVSMVLIAFFLVAGTTIFSSTSVKGVNVEAITVAQSLAEGKLEEICARDFSLVSSEAQTNYSGDLSQYSSQVVMQYVNSSDLDTPVAGPTDYKKVTVKIRYPSLTGSVDLVTLRVNY